MGTTEPLILIAAATLLASVTAMGLIALKGWSGWLDLRRLELEGVRDAHPVTVQGASPAARIELADLKERVRKLEAIAAGVDL